MHLAINGWFWDQPHTGSGQYLRNLLPALLAAQPGLQVTLIVPRPIEIEDSHNITVQVVPPPRRGHLGKLWFEQRLFPAACRGTDLAHIPYWGPPLRSPVPLITTVHDIIPKLLPAYRGGVLSRAYTALVSAAARGAAAVLTESEAARRDILVHLGIPAERVHRVYLAAGEAFRPVGNHAAVRAKYGVPETFVLYLGGFDVRKNVRVLLEAYAYVAEALGGEVPLVLAGQELKGESARFPALRPHIAALGLSDCVRFTGWVDEVDKPALMQLADCFVFPSRYEGFGLPPLEAMACGTPVVAADAASLPEVMGDAGFLVGPDDARAMAGAILAILTEEALAEALRTRGLAQAARFSWARAARETLAVYERIG